MPGFNINNFLSHINASGTLSASKFLMEILTPAGLLLGSTTSGTGYNIRNLSRELTELISFRGDSLRTPGVSLAASNIFRYGIGPGEKKPYNATFSDIGVSFLADKEGSLYTFFHSWINYIFNFSPGAARGTLNENPLNILKSSYSLSYKDYYSTDIKITVFDDAGNTVHIFNLLKAFPININEIPLSWSSSNNALRLNINFTFKEYILEDYSQKQFDIANNTVSSASVGTISQLLNKQTTSSGTNIINF